MGLGSGVGLGVGSSAVGLVLGVGVGLGRRMQLPAPGLGVSGHGVGLGKSTVPLSMSGAAKLLCSTPFSASAMNLHHMVAGKDPPVTLWPRTCTMGRISPV